MDAREKEQAMLNRCIAGALGELTSAGDQVEASIFRLAASALQTYRPQCADALRRSSAAYFQTHQESALSPAELIADSRIVTLPRLRSMLLRQLEDRERVA